VTDMMSQTENSELFGSLSRDWEVVVGWLAILVLWGKSKGRLLVVSLNFRECLRTSKKQC